MRKYLYTCLIVAVLPIAANAWDSQPNDPTVTTGPTSAKSVSKAKSTAVSQSKSAASGGTANVSVRGDGVGASNPALGVPSPSAPGVDCPVIGPGIGGQSGLSAGIFSWGYISPDCNKRRTTDILLYLYGKDVAQAYAEKNIEGVAEAVASVKEDTRHRYGYRYDYCYTATAGELKQHKECVYGE